MIALLISLAIADCCGNSWIRDAQTAKSLSYSSIVPLQSTQTFRLINASQATTVKDLQIQLTIALHRNPTATTTTGEVPPCPSAWATSCCDKCTRVYNVALYINLQQQVEFNVVAPNNDIFNPQSFNLGPLTSPPNYYGTLWSQNGLLQCFCDKDTITYNTATDLFYDVGYPEGIQLNNGDYIALVITQEDSECSENQSDGLQVVGTANFIYAYPSRRKA